MTPAKRLAKALAGTAVELVRRDLVREIEAGDHSGRGLRLKQWILHARLERARLRGDSAAVGRALAAYWQGDTGDFFYDRYRERFQTWFLGPHQVIVDQLARLSARRPYARLIEIGCGDGRVLDHCARRLPRIPAFLGLDINPTIIARNRQDHAGNPRLAFEAGEAMAWLPARMGEGTVLMTYGGVMEYFPPADLAQVFALLARPRQAAVALVAPVDPAHDLAADPVSHVFGQENSFSHPHRHMLETAGFTIEFEQEMPLGGVRWMLILAAKGQDNVEG